MKCWGQGRWGKLGNGSEDNQLTPVYVQGVTSATHVSVGSFHACAVLSEKKVVCWGRGDSGQLGYRNEENQFFPVEALIWD